jgi:hypothetical protein
MSGLGGALRCFVLPVAAPLVVLAKARTLAWRIRQMVWRRGSVVGSPGARTADSIKSILPARLSTPRSARSSAGYVRFSSTGSISLRLLLAPGDGKRKSFGSVA